MFRIAQLGKVGARLGTGLYGLDATGKPAELFFEEEEKRRYLVPRPRTTRRATKGLRLRFAGDDE